MKFPKKEPGKYTVDSECSEKCGCGETVSFKSGEVFKFCGGCGREHNKLRFGTSSYSYSDVMASELEKLLPKCMELFYESDVKSNGSGHRQLSLRRYHTPEISAYIDASRAIIRMPYETIYINIYANDTGAWSKEMRETTFENIRLEFTDREIYGMTKEELVNRISREAKGLWSSITDKYEYEKKRETMLNMSLEDIGETYIDPRLAPISRATFPKTIDAKVRQFFEEWEDILNETRKRRLDFNFTLTRPYSIMKAFKATGDAVVLTVYSQDNKDYIVTYKDIAEGKAPTKYGFDFSSTDTKLTVVKI